MEAAWRMRPVTRVTRRSPDPLRGNRRRRLGLTCFAAYCLAPLLNFASVDAAADPIPGHYLYCGERAPDKSENKHKIYSDNILLGKTRCSFVTGEGVLDGSTYAAFFKNQWQDGKGNKGSTRIYRIDPGRLRSFPKWFDLFTHRDVEFLFGLDQGNLDAVPVPTNPRIFYRQLYPEGDSFLMRVPFYVARDVFQWKNVTRRQVWQTVMKLWDDPKFRGAYAYMRNPLVQKKGNKFRAKATTDQTYYLLRFVLKRNDINSLDPGDRFDTAVFRELYDPVFSLRVLDTESNREYRSEGLIAFDSVMQSVCHPKEFELSCYGSSNYTREFGIYVGSEKFVREHLEFINWIPDLEPLVWQGDKLYLYGKSAKISVRIEDCASCNGIVVNAEMSPKEKNTIKAGEHRAMDFWAAHPRLHRMMLWRLAPDKYESQEDQLAAYEKLSGLTVKYRLTSEKTNNRSMLVFTGRDSGPLAGSSTNSTGDIGISRSSNREFGENLSEQIVAGPPQDLVMAAELPRVSVSYRTGELSWSFSLVPRNDGAREAMRRLLVAHAGPMGILKGIKDSGWRLPTRGQMAQLSGKPSPEWSQILKRIKNDRIFIDAQRQTLDTFPCVEWYAEKQKFKYCNAAASHRTSIILVR